MADDIIAKEIEGISDDALKRRIKEVVEMCKRITSYISKNWPAVPQKLGEQMPVWKEKKPAAWVDTVTYKTGTLEPAIREISSVLVQSGIPQNIQAFLRDRLNTFVRYRESIENAMKR